MITWSWSHWKYPELKQVSLPKITTVYKMNMLQQLLSLQTITSCTVHWQLATLTWNWWNKLALLFQTIIEDKGRTRSSWSPCRPWCALCCYGWEITGFSSLMDGYMRLDQSGIGPPPVHVLEQPVGKWSNLTCAGHKWLFSSILKVQGKLCVNMMLSKDFHTFIRPWWSPIS